MDFRHKNRDTVLVEPSRTLYCPSKHLSEASVEASLKLFVKSHCPCSAMAQIIESDSSDDDVVDFRPLVDLKKTAKDSKNFSLFMKDLQAKCTQRACDAIAQYEQRSEAWFTERVGRITASLFGRIFAFRSSSNPTCLIKAVLGISDPLPMQCLQYGIDNEPVARVLYTNQMETNGHPTLQVTETGLIVHPAFPHLGASPDGLVSCQCCGKGLVEIKCCASRKNLTPVEVAGDKTYTNVYLSDSKDVQLNTKSHWYSQIQGQMAICDRSWCDFVLYTNRGISITRVQFDKDFWLSLKHKLTCFYEEVVYHAIKNA